MSLTSASRKARSVRWLTEFRDSDKRKGALQKQRPFSCTQAEQTIEPKNGSRGRIFLTQRRREAENAEEIANLQFYRSDPNNLLFHPLGDVLLQVNLMHGSLYSQDSEHFLRSRPLCVSACDIQLTNLGSNILRKRARAVYTAAGTGHNFKEVRWKFARRVQFKHRACFAIDTVNLLR